MAYLVRPEEVLDYWYDSVNQNKTVLGFNYVGYADEEVLPEYPVVRISAGPKLQTYHATHKFLNVFNIVFWILHANMGVGHRVRSREDMQLATVLYEHLKADMVMSKYSTDGSHGVIDSHVDDETPGYTPNDKGRVVVATRLSWTGRGQEVF